MNKLLILFFILLAIPIPLSLISWLGTIMAVASIGMSNVTSVLDVMLTIVSFITMAIAGTYPVTYVLSLTITLKHKKSSILSFLPVFHILLFFVLFHLWIFLENEMKVRAQF